MKSLVKITLSILGGWFMLLAIVFVICIFIAGCSKSSVTPVDANAKFYGTWATTVSSVVYQDIAYSAPGKTIVWSKSNFNYKVLSDSLLGVSRHYYYELTSSDLVLRWKSNDSSYTYLFTKYK